MTVSAMKFSNALNATLKQFSINGKDLARISGVSESSISRYRRGESDIQAESLERLITALPPDARYYFYFNCLVKDIDEAGIAILLQAIAFKLKEEPVKIQVSGEFLALTPG